MSACTDAELVLAARGGNQSAFGELMERHRRVVSSFALKLEDGLRSESEEVTQEAFVVAWQRLSSLQDPAHFRQWLLKIVRRIHRQLHRSRRPESEAAGEEVLIVPDDPSPLDRH